MLPLPSPPGEVEDEAGLESLAATPPGKLGKVSTIEGGGGESGVKCKIKSLAGSAWPNHPRRRKNVEICVFAGCVFAQFTDLALCVHCVCIFEIPP